MQAAVGSTSPTSCQAKLDFTHARSRCNDLYFSATHCSDDGCRSSDFTWSGECSPSKPSVSSHQMRQVFYGRYVRRLTNQTQEAMGEMSKVSLPTTNTHGTTTIPGRSRSPLRISHRPSIQRHLDRTIQILRQSQGDPLPGE